MSKHIFLHSEIIFHEHEDERASKFVKEYDQVFENLDLSEVPRYNKGVGASGYGQHAMIKAMIVYTKEGYRSIRKLIRELEAKPYFSTYILGFPSKLLDESTFYRFIKNFVQRYRLTCLLGFTKIRIAKKRYFAELICF